MKTQKFVEDMNFLARLNESSERAIVFTLTSALASVSAQASELDILNQGQSMLGELSFTLKILCKV